MISEHRDYYLRKLVTCYPQVKGLIPAKRRDYADYSVRSRERISHRYRCIFIHIPKCAGSSVKKFLYGSHTGGDHATAMELRHLFPNEYETYFKFAVVRNPWDRVVSVYSYLLAGGNGSFRDQKVKEQLIRLGGFGPFCRHLERALSRRFPKPFPRHLWPQAWFLREAAGRPVCVDYLVRFEDMDPGLRAVGSHIQADIRIPRMRETPHSHYSEYYDDESRRLVESAYREDVELFGYRFD